MRLRSRRDSLTDKGKDTGCNWWGRNIGHLAHLIKPTHSTFWLRASSPQRRTRATGSATSGCCWCPSPIAGMMCWAAKACSQRENPAQHTEQLQVSPQSKPLATGAKSSAFKINGRAILGFCWLGDLHRICIASTNTSTFFYSIVNLFYSKSKGIRLLLVVVCHENVMPCTLL